MPNDQIKLSPSTLNLFADCKRCFYLEVKLKLSRPRGIFPSLPGGIDRTLKAYFDTFRVKGELPSELADKIQGRLALGLPKQLKYHDEKLNADLRGNLDECIEYPDGTFAALDFKTRASRAENIIPAYQTQLNLYTLLLEKTGHKTRNAGYLVYYYPESVEGGNFRFGIDIKEIVTSIVDAYRLFSEAVSLLNEDKIPDPSPDCEYCNFEKSRSVI